ncbi:MAG: TonB-dependent receptor [Ignavibacteriales bacterium]
MKYLLLLLTVVLFTDPVFSQTCNIKGTVTDSSSFQAVAEVSILSSGNKYNTASDQLGNFNLSRIEPGEYLLTFSRIGYKSREIKVRLTEGETRYLEVRLMASPVSLNEVNVTSTRYETSIRNVPLPLEVLSEDEARKINAVTVSDMLKNKPGVALERDGIWGTTVNIRGLSRSSIVTLIDGNRIETATDISAGLSLVDMNNVKRIEVIKGAASSLYGTGALGGIVNIISKTGQYSDSFSIGGSLISGYNSVNKGGSGSLSLSAGAPFWFAHISGTLRDAGNTHTPAGILNNSQFKDNSISADLGIRPLANNELKVNYQRAYASNVGIPGGSSLFPSNALVTYPTEERSLFSTEYAIKNISGIMQKISLKYYYQFIFRNVENIPYQVTRTPAQNGQPPKETDVLSITPNARHYTNGIQLQTDWTLGRNYVIAGVDAWQRDLDSRREKHLQLLTYNMKGDSVVKTVNQTVGERPLPESRFRSIGVYAQDEVKISEGLKAMLGGRFDQINISNTEVGNPVYVIVNGVMNSAPANRTINWKAGKSSNYSWSGNAGLLYSVTPGVDLNVNAARSFRSPSLEERYKYIDQGNIIYLGDPELKPEEGFYLDAGIRIFNEVFSVNLSTFLNSLRNMVVERAGKYEGKAALINANVGRARLAGFDLGAEYNFLSNYTFYASASYVSGKDLEEDEYLPQIPPLNGRLGFRIPVAGYASFDLSSTIFAAQNSTAPGEITTPGYAYFDLYVIPATMHLGGLDLNFSAGVENLTDKSYRNHLASNRGLIAIEPGRNVFVKLNLAW